MLYNKSEEWLEGVFSLKKQRMISGMMVLIVLLCMMLSGIGASAESKIKLGDINNSGEVDSDDLTALARHTAKLDILTEDALLAADVDLSGEVDADDLTLMARYVAKLIDHFADEDNPPEEPPYELDFDNKDAYIIIKF